MMKKVIFYKTLFPKISILMGFIFTYSSLFAQFMETFEDGDYTNNPTWSGNQDLFVVDNGQLRSNSAVENTYYLSTPSNKSMEARWEFTFNMRFATSGANYVDVYLISDVENILEAQNGYFVRVGNTSDEISLYSKINGIETEIIDGTDNLLNSSTTNPFAIKVKRNVENVWTLETDDALTGTYVLQGSIVDDVVQVSSFFGIKIIQSSASGPINKHFFDNIEIGDFCEPFQQNTQISSCISYLWDINNQTYTTSGVYEQNFTNIDGCDSTYILNLIINNTTNSSINEVACDLYTWNLNNQTYSSSGTYETTVINSNGCDSVITLNLIIHETTVPTLPNFEQICDTSSAFVLTQGLPTGGFYTLNGEVVTEFNPSIANIGDNLLTYTFENEGCEAETESNIIVVSCEENNLGLIDENSMISIYPNPSSSVIFIKTLEDFLIEKIELINLQGQVIFQKENSNFIDIRNFDEGFYNLNIFINSKLQRVKIQISK